MFIGDADSPHVLRFQARRLELRIDLRPCAVHQHQAHAKAGEQVQVVRERDEGAVRHDFATEAVLTITPRSPAALGCCFDIASAASRIMLKVPIRLMPMTLANFSSECGPSLPTVFSPMAMPAQLTRACKPPNSFSAAATAALPCASL